MNSIQPAIAELERAYHGLERLFPRDGVTRRDPAIVIQPSPSGSSVGWLTPRVWKNRRNQETVATLPGYIHGFPSAGPMKRPEERSPPGETQDGRAR